MTDCFCCDWRSIRGFVLRHEQLNVLYGYVLSRLQYWSEQVHRDDEKLLQQLLNAGNKERSAAKKQRGVELKRATKRKETVSDGATGTGNKNPGIAGSNNLNYGNQEVHCQI